MKPYKKPNKTKDKQTIEPPEKYKLTHKDKGMMLLLSSIVIVGLSLMSMSVAVYEVSIYLVIVGIFIEVSNAAVLYISIREHYAVNQYADKSDFRHLPPIGQSRIYFAPILAATYILWFLLVGFSAYHSAEKRNRQNTEEVTVELSTTNNQLEKTLLSLSSEEKKQKNSIDSLNKSLSLLNNKIADLNGKWSKRDEWTKQTYFYPFVRPLQSQKTRAEKELKEQKSLSFATEIEAKNTLQARVSELRQQLSDAVKNSNSDKWRDFWMHLFFTFLCVCAVTFIVFQKVRYDLFCGVGLDEVCKCEEPEEKRQSRTAILTEALESVIIERRGNGGKITREVTISTFLKWKSDLKYIPQYREACKQLRRRYRIIENGVGIPTLVKK